MSANLNTHIGEEAVARRVLWRCRRGLLELDIVLQRFVNQGYAALDAGQIAAFDRLLDRTDNALWDMLCGRQPCDCPQETAILDRMRHQEREAA